MLGGRNLNETHLRAYIGAETALAVALVASWIYWYGVSFKGSLVVGTVIVASLVLLGELFPVRLNDRFTMGTWDIVLIISIVVLGPTWTALAALPSAFMVARRDWLRMAHELSRAIIIVYLAGIVFSFASDPFLINDSEPTTAVFYGTLVTGITLLCANELINGIVVNIKYRQAFLESWKEVWQPYLLSDVINLLTAGLGVLALMTYGPVAAVVLVVGSVGSQALVCRSREHAKENRELRARIDSLEEALTTSNTIFGSMIIRDLGRRDGYTHRHAAATAVYAADLANELKLDGVVVERLRMAGLLHNIGLFSLPEELLLASGKLNSIARSQLAEHPVRGEQALAAVPEFKEMASWVRWHHERVDGRGYPDKLRETWIPIEAKILAVAQGYAAMVLDQPRRPGMSLTEAREQLVSEIDKQFDGTIVRAFLRILDTESEGYRMADDYRFLFPDPDAVRRISMTQDTLRTGTDNVFVRELPRP